MRSVLVPLLFAGLLLGTAGCGSDDASTEAPRTSMEARGAQTHDVDPYSVPDTTLRTLDGGQINLADQNGTVVLVNFWATWCPPCREEIPDLVELQSALEGDGFTVVGVALDREGTEVVRPFVREREINYPIVVDSTQAIEAHFDAMYGLPTTYVVDPDGRVVKRVLGRFPVEKMRPTLEQMLRPGSTGDAA